MIQINIYKKHKRLTCLRITSGELLFPSRKTLSDLASDILQLNPSNEIVRYFPEDIICVSFNDIVQLATDWLNLYPEKPFDNKLIEKKREIDEINLRLKRIDPSETNRISKLNDRKNRLSNQIDKIIYLNQRDEKRNKNQLSLLKEIES